MTLLEAHARIGGSGSVHPNFDIFQGIIDVLALIDLGFSGQATTWGDSTVRFVAKRLDRTLVNHEACLSWPNALVCHLPKLGSDHTPLLVTLDPSSAAWLTHANFHEFLSQSWSYDGPIVQALTRLRPKLVKWNKTVFKNIEEREKNLMGKLDVIQQQLMTDPNQDLISADSAVQHELLQVLHQEEIHWFQKSRELWLQSGDRNIAFFHSSTIIRRKRNFILMLKGETNVLYSLNVDELNPINLPHGLFPTLAEDRWEVLATPISDKEIQKAVSAMGAYKASGPDGLQQCFYQNLWNVVGPFWIDTWLADVRLIDIAFVPIDEDNRNATVRSYWSEEHGWEWRRLEGALPNTTLLRLTSVVVCDGEISPDTISWGPSPQGFYSVFLAYELIHGYTKQPTENEEVFKRIWKLCTTKHFTRLQQSALDNTGKLFGSTQQSKLKKMSNGMPTSETSEQEPEKMKQAVPTNDDDDDATDEQGKAKSKGEEGGKASKTILNGAVENGRGKSNDTSTNKKRMKELTGKDESDDASITTKRKKREFPTREEISKAREEKRKEGNH
ncbi:LOW QUALITY PROTEIN: hypothetical protein V2J09_001746 [Rumex salicifolius]